MAAPKPLTSYVDKLYRRLGLFSELKQYLVSSGNDQAADIISRLKSGKASKEDKELAADYLSEFMQNETDDETLFYASCDGESWFPIDVNERGGVFWVSVPEFPDIGYFDSREEAESAAWRMDLGDARMSLDPDGEDDEADDES